MGLEASRSLPPTITVGTRGRRVELRIGDDDDSVRLTMDADIAAQVAGALLDAVDIVRPEPWLIDGPVI